MPIVDIQIQFSRIIESPRIKNNILKLKAISIEKRITKPIPNIIEEEIDTFLFVLLYFSYSPEFIIKL